MMNNDQATAQGCLQFILDHLAKTPLVHGRRPPALRYNARGCYVCWKCKDIRSSNTFLTDNKHKVECGGKSVYVCLVCAENGVFFQCHPTDRADHIRDKHPECCPSSPSPFGVLGTSCRRGASASLRRAVIMPSSNLASLRPAMTGNPAEGRLKRLDETKSASGVLISTEYYKVLKSVMGDTNAKHVLNFCNGHGFGVPKDLYNSMKLVEESSEDANVSATPPLAKRQHLQLEPEMEHEMEHEMEPEHTDLRLHPIYGVTQYPSLYHDKYDPLTSRNYEL